MRRVAESDQGIRALQQGNKLLEDLISMEKSLTQVQRIKKYQDSELEEDEKFERTCKCHEKKNKQASDIAKHFLYHRHNPHMKWQVQSLKIEEQKQNLRAQSIKQAVSPYRRRKGGSRMDTDRTNSDVSIVNINRSLVGEGAPDLD